MAKKEAKVVLSADDRPFAKVLAGASKKWGAFGKMLGKGLGVKGGFGALKKFGGKGLGALKTAAGVGSVAGLAGMAALAGNEAHKTLKFEDALTRLKIASMGSIGSLDAVRRKVLAISNATGMAREDVLAGASAYVTLTGDTTTAVASMELFSKIAKGTGASMEDISASAAAMSQNLKINPADFEQAFSILIRGGKLGAVELKDMAMLMASLAPQIAQFGRGTGVQGLSELSAALQLTRQGFGTATEAATGLESLMGAIVRNSKKLQKSGVSVYEKDGKTLRNFAEIVTEIGSKKFTATKLIDLLGRKEAMQTIMQLNKIPNAWDAAQRATMGAKDAAEDYAEYQRSTAGQLALSWNELKNSIAEVFTPERIQAFTEGLQDFIRVAGAAKDIILDIGRATGLVDPTDEEKAEMNAKLKAQHKGRTDEDLEAESARYGKDSLLGQPATRELLRRKSERRVHENVLARMEGKGPTFGVDDGQHNVTGDETQNASYIATTGQLGPGRGKPSTVKVVVGLDPHANLIARVENAMFWRTSP